MGVRADRRKRGKLATENRGISWPHKEGDESWAKMGVGDGHRKGVGAVPRQWAKTSEYKQNLPKFTCKK